MNAQSAVEKTVHSPLIGRDEHIDAFESRLNVENSSAPIVITGPAGIGKTTLIRAYESSAREAGWRVLSDTPAKGLSDRMQGIYLPALHESLTGYECRRFENNSLAEQLLCVAEGLQTIGEGLLITIDHPARSSAQHLRELCDAVLQAYERELPVLLVVAGTGAEVRDLLDARGLEILDSAEHITLCSLTREQTETVLREEYARCAQGKARKIDDELVARAIQATYGYPAMVGLVGECVRRYVAAHDQTDEHFTTALSAVREKMGELVLKPLLEKLSAGDRAFLDAMSDDDSASKMSDIARRLGKTPQYAGVYRNRLVEAQIIKAASYGRVTFMIPHLREYLRAHKNVEDSFNNF